MLGGDVAGEGENLKEIVLLTREENECKRRLNVPALGRLKRTAPGVVCHCSWVDVACLGLA